MKLVSLVRTPSRSDEAARALAGALGLALAEARMRLAPEPPAVLARLDDEEADALVASLRKAGVASLAIDARLSTDKDRLLVRTFSLDASGATFFSRAGDSMRVLWTDVVAILRGLRRSRTEVERSEEKTKLSAMSDGFITTETIIETTRSLEEANEQVIFVYARGGRSVKLAGSELDFSCLGPGVQVSSTGNVIELARRLRDRAKGAFYDERLLRLGRRPLPFLAGGESRSQTEMTTVMRTDTSSSLDVLAEVMRQALAQGLLP